MCVAFIETLLAHFIVKDKNNQNNGAFFVLNSLLVLNNGSIPFLYCAGHTVQRAFSVLGEEVTQVLWSQFMQGLEDNCFRFTSDNFFNGLPIH